MEWTQDLSIGIEAIDEQHKTWLGLLSDFKAAFTAGKGPSAIERTLTGVIDYTQTHFADEERMLETAGYPQLAEHKTLHRNFVNDLRAIQARKREEIAVTFEMYHSMKTWLTQHIMQEDRKYALFIKANPTSGRMRVSSGKLKL